MYGKIKIKPKLMLVALSAVLMVGLSVNTTVFANDSPDNVPKLADVLTAEPQATSSSKTESTPSTEPSNQIDPSDYDSFIKYSKVDMSDERVGVIGEKLHRVGGLVVACILTGLAAALPISLALDLAYIILPFIRTFLRKEQPEAPASNNYNNNNSYGNSSYSSYDSFGGGGGNSYGGNSYGGNNYGGNTSSGAMGTIKNMKLVSDEAVYAVVEAAKGNNGGEKKNALLIFGKESSIKLALTGVMIVLISSGALFTIGIRVGTWLVMTLSSISF